MRRLARARQHYCLLLGCAWVGWVLAGCGAGEATPAAEDGRAAEQAAVPDSTADELPVVLFLGTSLSAGYGLAPEQAFPALLQRRIDDVGLDFRVVNAGVSGDTSAGGLRRLDWLLRQPVAVLVLELGANDMLRGQDVRAMRRNLRAILDRTRAAYPGARFVIAGMRAAPNLGEAYVEAFEKTFSTLAREYGAALVPFLLEGVAGNPALNQADGIHPTAEGQRRMAEAVWVALGPLLRELR